MGAPKIGPGHYIREWRLFSDMTLEQLGDRINLTHATLSRIERGKTAYTQQVLERLAEVLSCQPADLICRDPDPLAQYRRKQEPKVSEKKNRTEPSAVVYEIIPGFVASLIATVAVSKAGKPASMSVDRCFGKMLAGLTER